MLDEADEMLSMGFKDDMDAILATTPKEKQTLLFSATLPHEIMRIVKTYMDALRARGVKPAREWDREL